PRATRTRVASTSNKLPTLRLPRHPTPTTPTPADSEILGDLPSGRVGHSFPVFGPLTAALRRIEGEIDGAIAKRIERLGADPADELGVQSLRGDAAAREIVVARKELKHVDHVGSERLLVEMTEQFRGVVRRVGPSPFQLDESHMTIGTTRDVDRRGGDVVFDFPVESRSEGGEALAKARLDGGGERTHRRSAGRARRMGFDPGQPS